MTPPASAPVIARVVTVHRQWGEVARWIDDPALADPRAEWIFVNDAPDSPAPAALRETAVGRTARFVEDGVNRGRCGARNRGADLSAAPWLAHVDGDDRPLPLPPVFPPASGGHADLLFLPFARPGGGEAWTEERIDTAVFGDLFALLGVPGPVDWRPASLVWRREFFGAVAGYDARFEGAEDAHVVWKALRAGVRTARGASALVSVAPGGVRAGLLYLATGRLRFWDEVTRAGGPGAEPGGRAYAVQLRVVFWTARDAFLAAKAPSFGGGGLIEGLKMILKSAGGR